MIKIIIVSILLIDNVFGGELDAGITVLNKLRDLLTGDLFQAIISLVFIFSGYMYITGKGQQAKENLTMVMIGSIIILGASAFAELIS
jgi:type IV secretory pathway VirB2 component (pilin)